MRKSRGGFDLFVGIDIGTSGIRAVAINPAEELVGDAGIRFGGDPKNPAHWRETLRGVLNELFECIDPAKVRALAVDGTSGTMLAVRPDGIPASGPLMYNDNISASDTLSVLEAAGMKDHATNAIGRAFHLAREHAGAHLVHQADWISGLLTDRFDISDENNALKTGYDPETKRWNDDLKKLNVDISSLPHVVPAGTPIATTVSEFARSVGLTTQTIMVAGTTDGCASFLATGANRIGDGVTALGSTMTLKLLSADRIVDANCGVYSHRVMNMWLAGGASNSGGAVLAQNFGPEEIRSLSSRMRVHPNTDLSYYPLPAIGERFPKNDPGKKPVLTPRPDNESDFLKGLFEGMADIEAVGYERLAELGGPPLKRLYTVGGGAVNAAWTGIRAARLGLNPETPASTDAAYGTARLARWGLKR